MIKARPFLEYRRKANINIILSFLKETTRERHFDDICKHIVNHVVKIQRWFRHKSLRMMIKLGANVELWLKLELNVLNDLIDKGQVTKTGPVEGTRVPGLVRRVYMAAYIRAASRFYDREVMAWERVCSVLIE